MITRTSGRVENACLLVKLEGDPQTYAVVLEPEARKLLAHFAAAFSDSEPLTLTPFEGIEFREPEKKPTARPTIVLAKRLSFAQGYAASKDWSRQDWHYAAPSKSQNFQCLREMTEVVVILNGLTPAELAVIRLDAAISRLSLKEVTI